MNFVAVPAAFGGAWDGWARAYFAAYNLVSAPVVDDENHLLGAVTVDDLLDHLLPSGWRSADEPGPDSTQAITDNISGAGR